MKKIMKLSHKTIYTYNEIYELYNELNVSFFKFRKFKKLIKNISKYGVNINIVSDFVIYEKRLMKYTPALSDISGQSVNGIMARKRNLTREKIIK